MLLISDNQTNSLLVLLKGKISFLGILFSTCQNSNYNVSCQCWILPTLLPNSKVLPPVSSLAAVTGRPLGRILSSGAGIKQPQINNTPSWPQQHRERKCLLGPLLKYFYWSKEYFPWVSGWTVVSSELWRGTLSSASRYQENRLEVKKSSIFFIWKYKTCTTMTVSSSLSPSPPTPGHKTVHWTLFCSVRVVPVCSTGRRWETVRNVDRYPPQL